MFDYDNYVILITIALDMLGSRKHKNLIEFNRIIYPIGNILKFL